MGGADLGEELAHTRGVHFGANLPVQFSLAGTDRAVNVGELPFVAVVHHRTMRNRSPTTFDSDHAPEAGFVLKHHANVARFHWLCGEQTRQDFRKFFFKPSWILGSAFGWRVSGATFRQPWRSSMRYRTVAATGRPIFWASAARKGDTTKIPPSLACCTHGAKKASSSAALNKARRRPPQFRCIRSPRRPRARKRAWSRPTLARPIPRMTAVCSKVAPAKAGNRIAWAQRNSSALCAAATAARARFTAIESIRSGLDMPDV